MWGRTARFNIWVDSGKSNIVYCEERYKGRQARTAMVFEGSTERVLVHPAGVLWLAIKRNRYGPVETDKPAEQGITKWRVGCLAATKWNVRGARNWRCIGVMSCLNGWEEL